MSEAGYRLAQSVELLMCQRDDAVVAVSERDTASLAADGANYARLHMISHGVDLQQSSRCGRWSSTRSMASRNTRRCWFITASISIPLILRRCRSWRGKSCPG